MERSGQHKTTDSARRCHMVALVCIGLVAGCSRPDLETMKSFQQAESAFADAETTDEFALAASQYDQALENGFVSGAALYNQGNAWMRAGETGRAIACWRQAQRYRPRDPYLAANLQSALAACQSAAPLAPNQGVGKYVFFWQDWLSYPEKFLLTTVFLSLTCTVGLLSPWVARQRTTRRLLVAGGIVTLVMVASAVWDWQRFSQTTHGVVVTDTVEARKGNAESYEAAFTTPIGEGTEFTVLEERSGWLNIQLADLGSAWIPSRAAVTY